MIRNGTLTRNTLIQALCACAENKVRGRARRFLVGLSSDELQFLTEILGACILESSEDIVRAAEKVQVWQCCEIANRTLRCDQERKMILLREFLSRSRLGLAVSGDPGSAAA